MSLEGFSPNLAADIVENDPGVQRLRESYGELVKALKALDAIHMFQDTLEHEDWGLYLDEAIPEVRKAYQLAIVALQQAEELELQS